MGNNAERIHAALQAMLSGKLLYHNTIPVKFSSSTLEGAIFIDPENPCCYVAMSFTYNEREQFVGNVTCEYPWHQALLSDLGFQGKYVDYQEIAITHPEAQRVLAMYRAYMQLNAFRVSSGKQLIDATRAPSAEEIPLSSSDTTVEYV